MIEGIKGWKDKKCSLLLIGDFADEIWKKKDFQV